MTRDTVLFVNTRPSSAEAEPCFRAAHRLGLDVVLLADRPTPVPPGSYQDHVALDTYDTSALVQAAERVASARRVVGVVCWGDRDVEGTAHVAAALGLPGHSVAAAATARNKGKLRNLLATAAPDLTVRHHRLSDATEEEAAAAALHVRFPAILKPVGASSSKGIFMVSDEAELGHALRTLGEYVRPEVDPIFSSSSGELVMEEYVEGSEHSVEGLVLGTALVAAAVTDKWVEPEHFLEYRQIHPSGLPEDRRLALIDAARRTVEAVGLDTGAFHLEMRLCSDGSIRVIELNARTGGGYITSHLIPLSRGYEFLESTLRLACGMQAPWEMRRPYAVAGSHKVLASSAGRLQSLGGLELALRGQGVLTVVPERPLGADVLLPPDGYTEGALASVIAVGCTSEAVTEAMAAAAAAIEPNITA